MDLFLCGVFVQPGVAKDEGMKFAITTLEISRKYALALPSSSLTAAFNSQEWVIRFPQPWNQVQLAGKDKLPKDSLFTLLEDTKKHDWKALPVKSVRNSQRLH